jgi:two-component system, OmpR family, response regulator QseB
MNILFIEDDAMNRRVVRDMLDVAGATMAEADRAEEGLRRIDQEAFDVILVDLRMPGIDGYETIRRIRDRPDEKRALPIIVVTADTGADLAARCKSLGADEVLFKPVAMDALFDAIGRILASRSDGSQTIF